MTDTIFYMADGSKWKPATSSDTVHCTNCGCDSQDCHGETCPECNTSWTGGENRSTSVMVTAPEAILGES